MLRLPVFDYHTPQTLAGAVALKKEHGANAMFVAGGTDLYPKMKRRQMEPQVLIGLSQIAELRTFEPEEEMVIGAGMTLAEVAGQPHIQACYPALAKAAELVSSPPLRNAGTIGGNLCVDTRCTYYDQTFEWRQALGFCLKKDGDICWVAKSSPKCLAVSSSDTAPVLIALGAQVRLVGPDGERRIPVEALYRDDGQFYLAKSPDELLASIHLPPRPGPPDGGSPAGGWRMTYLKLRRRGTIDFPILGVAAALDVAADGRCRDGRVVLGAVASQPVVLDALVQEMLVGQPLTPERIEQFAQKAYRPAKPMDNTDMNLSYRKKVTRVFIRRALTELAPQPAV